MVLFRYRMNDVVDRVYRQNDPLSGLWTALSRSWEQRLQTGRWWWYLTVRLWRMRLGRRGDGQREPVS